MFKRVSHGDPGLVLPRASRVSSHLGVTDNVASGLKRFPRFDQVPLCIPILG